MNAVVSVEIEEWRSDELRDYVEARNAEDGDWLSGSSVSNRSRWTQKKS